MTKFKLLKPYVPKVYVAERLQPAFTSIFFIDFFSFNLPTQETMAEHFTPEYKT